MLLLLLSCCFALPVQQFSCLLVRKNGVCVKGKEGKRGIELEQKTVIQ